MEFLTCPEAFARYGATLQNVQWSACAAARDGSLVVGMWSHNFNESVMEYRDSFVHWPGPGRNELRQGLSEAHVAKRDISVVLVVANHPLLVDYAVDGSRIRKVYRPREELVGQVVSIDDKDFVIALRLRPRR